MNGKGILGLLSQLSSKAKPIGFAAEAASNFVPWLDVARYAQSELDPTGRYAQATQAALDFQKNWQPNYFDAERVARPMDLLAMAAKIQSSPDGIPVPFASEGTRMQLEALNAMRADDLEARRLRDAYMQNERNWNDLYAGVERQNRELNNATAKFRSDRAARGMSTTLDDVKQFRRQYKTNKFGWENFGQMIRSNPKNYQRNLPAYVLR